MSPILEAMSERKKIIDRVSQTSEISRLMSGKSDCNETTAKSACYSNACVSGWNIDRFEGFSLAIFLQGLNVVALLTTCSTLAPHESSCFS